jgi:23S rRNA (adenine2503-C2)-methyltransferase
MNPHPDSPHRPASPAATERFLGEVVAGGLTVTLRRPRGLDIDAACGQLANRSR